MNNMDIKQLLSGKTGNWNNILVEDKQYSLYNSERNAIIFLYITYYEHLPILIPILIYSGRL